MIFAVLCTGESLKQEDVDYLQGRCGVVAVSDAYVLAPWADALVSYDQAWWIHKEHKDALAFAGPKYHCAPNWQNSDFTCVHPGGGNSGVLGLTVAHRMGATKILLLGADGKGSHFFGKHPKGLRESDATRFSVMSKQYAKWKGCPVVNCSPVSVLKCFPRGNLRDEI